MKLKATIAALLISTSMVQAEESQAYFAEAVNLWDNVYFSTSKSNMKPNQPTSLISLGMKLLKADGVTN